MRYTCLIAVLIALPLTVSAQDRRAVERRSDHTQAEQRRSENRRAEHRGADERRSDRRRSDHDQGDWKRPAQTSAVPWWERQQAPWWERQQTPAWELNRIPGYAQGNVARAMLDQQRIQQQRSQHPQSGNNRWSRHYAPSVVYVLPAYRYFPESLPTTTQFVVTPPPPTAPVPAEPLPPMGALRLDVEPKESLQIFVDGVYVGTPADLGDELELAPGTRRIELRARGYRTVTFSAEIVDGRSITYRGTLERSESVTPVPPVEPAAQAPPAAPAGSKTMYMIPGCYLGNVSPKNVALRPGCDISKLTTITP